MNTQEITILKTWQWEEFIINGSYEDFIKFKKNLQEQWLDWFDSKDYRRFIKFASLEHIIWKTKYLSLPEPKEVKKILTKEQEEQYKTQKEDFIKLCLLKSEEKRRNNFLKDRELMLKNLAKKEKYWNMYTTLEKIEELNKYRKKELLNIVHDV